MTLKEAIDLLETGDPKDPWRVGCECDKCSAFLVVLSAAEKAEEHEEIERDFVRWCEEGTLSFDAEDERDAGYTRGILDSLEAYHRFKKLIAYRKAKKGEK
jgi:hypothetical protein